MNDRINDLKNMVKDDPDDPFMHYALGLEYVKIRDLNQALEHFETIFSAFPGYLPVYYQAAQLYIEMGEMNKAEKTFKSGIELAKKLSETKTLQELSNAYNNLLLERDD